MYKVPSAFGTRSTLRLALAGMTAALLAGCADSSRFIGDPLGNPFKSASNAPAPPANVDREMSALPTYRPMHTAAIQSQPLAPPSDVPAHRVASYETSAHESPRLASNYNPPRTERTASIPAPSGHGSWSASGGMPVIAANGETAKVLAERYNVPVEALLHENNFTSAGQIHPGTRVVIPVYSATGGTSRVAASEPPRPVHDHSSRERLIGKHEMTKQETAKRDTKDERADGKVARRDVAGKMHWVKGAQPATEAHGRDTALAEAERVKADKLAKAEQIRAAKKTAKLDASAARKTAQAETGRAPVQAVVRQQPVKMAKVDDVPIKKAATDPTPTASLPPADKPISANGNPEFRWPAHGRIIQGFKSGGNDGINIAVPEGTQVKAAESGVVAYAGNEIKGFGNLVLIRHPNGYVTAYANNGSLDVKRGEQVKRGQTIAVSGQSGNVASPQLHFEVRKGSTPVDPTRYLAGL